MKALSFSVLALLFSAQAMAAASSPIKTCSAEMTDPSGHEKAKFKIEVFSRANSYFANFTMTEGDESETIKYGAKLSEFEVRPGLTPLPHLDDESVDFNMGERYIAYAMNFDSDPELSRLYSSGIDLKTVRSVKLYVLIDPAGQPGLVTVISAKDQSGKDMGSFLYAFPFISPCK